MKKTTKLCVALLAVLGMAMVGTGNSMVQKLGFGVTAHAFAQSGSCGSGVYYALNDDYTALSIFTDGSGTGVMDSYTGVANCPWYNGSTAELAKITSLTIGEGVTSIGGQAFAGQSFTTVTIPKSVQTIGLGAFATNTKLESITIPETVTSLGAMQFYGDTELNDLTVLGANTLVGANLFYNGSTKVIIKCFKGSKIDTTYTTQTKKYLEEKSGVSVTVPVPTNKWIHKVGITFTNGTETQDCEVKNYEVVDGLAYFDDDITVNSYIDGSLPYETYYIYNHQDGDCDQAIADGKYSDASNDVGDVDPEELFKVIIEQSRATFELKEVN